MNNILIVDGYNAIHQIPELRARLKRGLEFSRSGLAGLVSSWNRNHPGFDCRIVFDGNNSAPGPAKTTINGVSCFFTRTKSEADDEILRNVREYRGDKAAITVVSDDNYVRNNSKAHGAQVQSVSYLVASPKNGPKGRPPESKTEEKIIDSKTASQINKELRIKYGL